MDEVFVDFLSRSAEAREAMFRFAGLNGEALSIEGWAVPGSSMLTYRLSTEVHRPRHATVVLLRHSPGADLEIVRGGETGTSEDTATGEASGSPLKSGSPPASNPISILAPQIQIVSTGGFFGAGNAEQGTQQQPIGEVFRGLQRMTRSWLSPLAHECAENAATQSGAGDGGDEAAEGSGDGAEMSGSEVKMAVEVARKAAELRGALENLHKQQAIPTLRLEVTPLVAAAVKHHGLGTGGGDGGSGGDDASSGGGEVDVDALCLGPTTLALPPGFTGGGGLPEYNTFLNDLQRVVTSSWKKEVSKLAAMTREPFRASVAEEVGFWRALAEAVAKAEKQFSSPGARAMLQVLRSSNRNININLSDMTKSLQKATAHCTEAEQFYSEFPIAAGGSSGASVDSASHLPALLACVDVCFAVAPRKVRGSGQSFKLERVVEFFGSLEKSVATRASFLLDGNGTTISGSSSGTHGEVVAGSDAAANSGGLLGGGSTSTTNTATSLSSTNTRLMGLPYREFCSRLGEFGALAARWMEGFFGLVDAPPLPVLAGAVSGGAASLAIGTSAGMARRSSEGGAAPDRPATRSGRSATVSMAGMSAGGPLCFADFLREQAPSRGLKQGSGGGGGSGEDSSKAKAQHMRVLLDALKAKQLLPKMMDRLQGVAAFRQAHEELKSTLEDVFAGDLPPQALAAVEDAYAHFAQSSPVLQGLDKPEFLEPHFVAYYQRVGRVEQQVTEILTTKLEATANADEMFAVFRRYNRLFVRPNIRCELDLLRFFGVDVLASRHDKICMNQLFFF
jgi:hypothetical protein